MAAEIPPRFALMVAVNLSGKHLQQATLIDEVRDVIQTTGIEPSSLIIEITERWRWPEPKRPSRS